MYLVDTSVWVDFVRGRDAPHVGLLRELLSNPLSVSVTHLVYMEVLQGARDPAAQARLKDYFDGQHFVTFKEPMASHAAAARIYLDCRQRGVTIRSAIDCVLAQYAMEFNLTLLHHDRDFLRIAGVIPRFRQQHFLQ